MNDYDGTYSLNGEIHIVDLDKDSPYTLGQDTIRSSVDHAMNPRFSSDGRQLVFMGLSKNNHPTDATWCEALDIFMYDFEKNQLTNLSQAAGLGSSIDEDPAFSPDRTKVVFKRSRSDLWELSIADYSLKKLTNSASVEKSGPRYSPDGKWILFWVGDGAGSYIGKIPSSGGTIQVVVDNSPGDSPGIQDYFPSYWGDDKIIYTSWDTPQYYPARDDDDIKIYDLSNSSDVFAVFNTTSDDSDSFPLTDSVIGFSTNYYNSSGKWDLWYGNPSTGTAQRFDFSNTDTHDLGGAYTPYIVNFVCSLPSVPSSLDADATSSSTIHLGWADNSDNEDGFRIYRTDVPGSPLAVLPANTTSYDDTGLTAETQYCYTVAAFSNTCGESVRSNQDCVTTFVPDITVTDSIAPSDDLQVPFSEVTEGNFSEATVIVANDGSANLEIYDIASANPLEAPFRIESDSCSAGTLSPGASCTLTVRFEPTTDGTFNDTFNIPSDDPNEDPVTVSVSGNGVVPGTFLEDTNKDIPSTTAAVSWGDYDNDGDQDSAMIGDRGYNDRISELYINDGFQLNLDSTQSFLPIGGYQNEGSIVWIDYDNDGDLDLAYCGYSGETYATKIYENDNGYFIDSQQNVSGLTGHLYWGDYDNNGDLDLFITGYRYGPFSRIYKNQDGILEWDSSQNIDNLKYSSASWGDYDKDGDFDLVHFGDNGSEYVANIYNNNNGVLTKDSIHSITGLDHSTVAWVDYDSDGDLDIAVTGCMATQHIVDFYIYENIEGQFVEDVSNRIEGIGESQTFTYGDYDNDGDYDFVIGINFYKNENGTLTVDSDQPTLGAFSLDFGDFDNDGDLDLITSGYMDVKIYKNTIEVTHPNSMPIPPASESLISQVSASEMKVVLSWGEGTDYETGPNVLTYNLRVGTSPGSNDIMSGIIPPGSGNVGHALSYVIRELEPGTYYWSVQTVDTGFAKSEWTSEKIFIILVDDVCEGDFDEDGDVDGSDLAVFAGGVTGDVALEDFAANFGKSEWPN